MKICIINGEAIETAGGAGTASHSISKELAKFGHDVHYIVNSLDKYWESKSDKISIYHTEIKHKHPHTANICIRTLHLIWNTLNWSRDIRKLIKKIHPDIVLSFQPDTALPVYLYNLMKSPKIPYVLSIRHDPLLRFMLFLSRRTKNIWSHYPFIKEAKKITTPSISLSKKLASYFKKEVITIPNGIDTKIFYQKERNNDKMFKKQELLCLSRLSSEKGIVDAIRAMPKICLKCPHVKLRIVGSGSEKEKLENICNELNLQKMVTFIGHVPHDEVTSYYQSASVYLFPSLNEGFPNSVIEAIACGLPLVTTPVADLGNIIPKAENGIVVPFNSPDAIADAVCTLLEDKNKYICCANNSLELAKQYSWKNVALQYEKLFTTILKPKA